MHLDNIQVQSIAGVNNIVKTDILYVPENMGKYNVGDTFELDGKKYEIIIDPVPHLTKDNKEVIAFFIKEINKW